MEEELQEVFFPTLLRVVRQVENEEVIQLDRLPWDEIGAELCRVYLYLDHRWILDTDTQYMLPTAEEAESGRSDQADEVRQVTGLQIFITTSSSWSVRMRLIQAASLHLDTLANAICEEQRAAYRGYLAGALVYAMGWMCRGEAKDILEKEIMPAIYEQSKEDVIRKLRGVLNDEPAGPTILTPHLPWMDSRVPVWPRITQQARDERREQGLTSRLRQICQNGTAKELCDELSYEQAIGNIDLRYVEKKTIYEELDRYFGPLPYTLRNFNLAYRVKK